MTYILPTTDELEILSPDPSVIETKLQPLQVDQLSRTAMTAPIRRNTKWSASPLLGQPSRESVLHSWIIDNVETVVALTKDPKDKEELRLVLSVEDQDKWTLRETGPFGHIRDTHLRRHRHLLQLEVPPWFLPTFVQWKHPHTPA